MENKDLVQTILNQASIYNIFVEDDFSVNGANCLGNIMVGGNATVPSNYYSNDTVIGGKVTKGGSFYNGSTTPLEANINVFESFEKLREISKKISKICPNGKIFSDVNNSLEIVFQGDNTNINVFTISASEFNEMVENNENLKFTLDIPKDSFVIINITGFDDINLNANNGVFYAGEAVTKHTPNNQYILFNVPFSNSVSIGASIGNLLAPSSKILSSNISGHDYFEGQIICKSYTGTNIFGELVFDGNQKLGLNIIEKMEEGKAQSIEEVKPSFDVFVEPTPDVENLDSNKTSDNIEESSELKQDEENSNNLEEDKKEENEESISIQKVLDVITQIENLSSQNVIDSIEDIDDIITEQNEVEQVLEDYSEENKSSMLEIEERNLYNNDQTTENNNDIGLRKELDEEVSGQEDNINSETNDIFTETPLSDTVDDDESNLITFDGAEIDGIFEKDVIDSIISEYFEEPIIFTSNKAGKYNTQKYICDEAV